jgi:hypothetical protein
MRFILATLGFVFVVIMVVVLFAHGGSKTATTPGNKAIKLQTYANDSSVQVEYNIEGPINAPENHRTIQIIVSPNSRTLRVLKGYQGEVMTSQTYSNDTNSYSNFLRALNIEGFTHERSVPAGTNSQAICPLNNRTHYLIEQGSKNLMDLWSATCNSGSFAGNIALVRSLFTVQIPNYGSLTNGISVAGAPTGGIF